MKRVFSFFMIFVLAVFLAACGKQAADDIQASQTNFSNESEQTEVLVSTEEATSSDNSENGTPSLDTEDNSEQVILMTFGEQVFEIVLSDSPAVNSLYEMPPLTVTFEDFNATERIAYLTEPLNMEGEPREFDPDIGDFCWYEPWGNLSLFYKDFRNSNGLISRIH